MKEGIAMARNKYPEETQRKILDVSFRLFTQKGYDHTTIQDIVDALGMSKGAVYHHFKSKEDILDHLYDRYYVDSKMFDLLEDPSLSGLEKLRELLRRQLADPGKLDIDGISISFENNPQLIRLLLTTSVRDAAPIIQRLLEEGNADGSLSTPYPKEAAESFLVLLNLWAGIFSRSREDFMAKFRFLQAMADGLGIPVFDQTLMDTLDAYYTRVAHKLSAQ
ncbi:MAG: TetR/AcrR family transcriptional regulator [Oscillospiraceae bacterium]|nr:TetR/AcrR family transcriptional regulator [Oscillospiraceae bacterium]